MFLQVFRTFQQKTCRTRSEWRAEWRVKTQWRATAVKRYLTSDSRSLCSALHLSHHIRSHPSLLSTLLPMPVLFRQPFHRISISNHWLTESVASIRGSGLRSHCGPPAQDGLRWPNCWALLLAWRTEMNYSNEVSKRNRVFKFGLAASSIVWTWEHCWGHCWSVNFWNTPME